MNEFEAAFNKITNQFYNKVDDTLEETLAELADEARDMVSEKSPKDTGDYAKGWEVKHESKNSYIVHNATDYQLTHLLEKGHDIVAWGRNWGHVKGKKHIKPVERWLQKEAAKKFKENMK